MSTLNEELLALETVIHWLKEYDQLPDSRKIELGLNIPSHYKDYLSSLLERVKAKP